MSFCTLPCYFVFHPIKAAGKTAGLCMRAPQWCLWLFGLSQGRAALFLMCVLQKVCACVCVCLLLCLWGVWLKGSVFYGWLADVRDPENRSSSHMARTTAWQCIQHKGSCMAVCVWCLSLGFHCALGPLLFFSFFLFFFLTFSFLFYISFPRFFSLSLCLTQTHTFTHWQLQCLAYVGRSGSWVL